LDFLQTAMWTPDQRRLQFVIEDQDTWIGTLRQGQESIQSLRIEAIPAPIDIQDLISTQHQKAGYVQQQLQQPILLSVSGASCFLNVSSYSSLPKLNSHMSSDAVALLYFHNNKTMVKEMSAMQLWSSNTNRQLCNSLPSETRRYSLNNPRMASSMASSM
jgi:hypothetical protein